MGSEMCIRDRFSHHFGLEGADGGHAHGVLRRDRRDRGGAMNLERGEGSKIGVDAGSTTGIRARNGHHAGWLHVSTLPTPR